MENLLLFSSVVVILVFVVVVVVVYGLQPQQMQPLLKAIFPGRSTESFLS